PSKVVLIRRFIVPPIAGIFLVFAIGIYPSRARAQAPVPNGAGENQFSVSLTMFSTLAAINAAGYDVGLDSPLNQKFRVRNQIRDALAGRTIPCLQELKTFYKEHRKGTESADLGQYISFALVAGDA